jgi:hypothetical protein
MVNIFIFVLVNGKILVVKKKFGVRVLVFNATFNNISAISLRSVLLVKETGGPGENHPLESDVDSMIVIFEQSVLYLNIVVFIT